MFICCKSLRIYFSGIDSLRLLLDRAAVTGCSRCLRPPCRPLPACTASSFPGEPVQRNIQFFSRTEQELNATMSEEIEGMAQSEEQQVKGYKSLTA